MNLSNLPEIRETATTLAKSTLCPSHFKKPEDALFAILKGAELGLPPVYSLSNISVINGKPSLGTDLMVGLAKRSPEWGGMSVEYSDDKESCTVTIRRVYPNGSEDTSTATFTLAQAKAAQLVRPGSPWDKYPARMLKHRATSWAIRDAFPDLLAGTYDVDEVQEITARPESVEFEVLDSADPKAALVTDLSTLHRQQAADYKAGKYTAEEITAWNQRWLGVDKTMDCTSADKAANAVIAYDAFRQTDLDELIESLVTQAYHPAAITRARNKYGDNRVVFYFHLLDKISAKADDDLTLTQAEADNV